MRRGRRRTRLLERGVLLDRSSGTEPEHLSRERQASLADETRIEDKAYWGSRPPLEETMSPNSLWSQLRTSILLCLRSAAFRWMLRRSRGQRDLTGPEGETHSSRNLGGSSLVESRTFCKRSSVGGQSSGWSYSHHQLRFDRSGLSDALRVRACPRKALRRG